MILLDTHVALWALSDPAKLSDVAGEAVSQAADVAVAGISWYELAWLIDAGRVEVDPDPRTWLRDAAMAVTTLSTTWEIAHRAADLSRHPRFPKDPADRLIYATALVHSIPLVTKDDRLREFDDATCRW
jgi:PIN domain nuclease of toxin-antitoxin system